MFKLSDPSRPIGARRSRPFGSHPKGIPWRAWFGPVLIYGTRPLAVQLVPRLGRDGHGNVYGLWLYGGISFGGGVR